MAAPRKLMIITKPLKPRKQEDKGSLNPHPLPILRPESGTSSKFLAFHHFTLAAGTCLRMGKGGGSDHPYSLASPAERLCYNREPPTSFLPNLFLRASFYNLPSHRWLCLLLSSSSSISTHLPLVPTLDSSPSPQVRPILLPPPKHLVSDTPCVLMLWLPARVLSEVGPGSLLEAPPLSLQGQRSLAPQITSGGGPLLDAALACLFLAW